MNPADNTSQHTAAALAADPAPASVFAVELLGALIRRGIRDVVVCPGSRSQALALAAAAAEQAGAIRLHVRIDERSAAYFALGIARETRLPAPIIVTSGTAVANLAPAVSEAREARIPMILLTADRPAELRSIRSNQTTHQAALFTGVAKCVIEVAPPEDQHASKWFETTPPAASTASALSAAPNATKTFTPCSAEPDALATLMLHHSLGAHTSPGPVHANLAFREPLSDTRGFDTMITAGFTATAEERDSTPNEAQQPEPAPAPARADEQASKYTHDGDALTVVLAGADAGPEAEAFAYAAGVPLLAEVVSGARYGRHAITAYATLLEDPGLGGLIERVIVFGHPTLTRQAPGLLCRADVTSYVVDPHPESEHYNPGNAHQPPRPATRVTAAEIAPDYDRKTMRRWLAAWTTADRQLQHERSTVHAPNLTAALETGYKERSAYARAEVAALRTPISREMLAESLWRASWPHDRLVLAASRLVRVLDAIAPPRRVEVHANRGLAGIDGTIATALGIAAASQSNDNPVKAAGCTRVLIGDLALLHDAGSLLLPPQPTEATPRIQLFVGNDGGGTIFDGLEVAQHPGDAFERVMYTPQRINLTELAAAYGWHYKRITTRGELEELLKAPVTVPEIIEVPLPRKPSQVSPH